MRIEKTDIENARLIRVDCVKSGETVLDRYARFLIYKSPAVIDAALRHIIRSAYDDVSLFREKLDAVGITPNAIQSRRDLQKLPIASSNKFRDSPTAEYTNRNSDLTRCQKSSTSGTTGVPLYVYMSRSESAYRKLVLFNAIRRNIHLSLPFRIVEVGTGAIGIAARRMASQLDPVQVCHISRTLPIDEQLERLIRARPHVITGHPSCLELVAEEIRGWCSAEFSPRLVVYRGELLSNSTRSMLRDNFGCKIVDYYSCDEVGNIAWECPVNEHRLHISTDGCVVEVVDDRGAPLPTETEGFILVTNLFNCTMPFVRYRLGDRGSLLGEDDVCSCGYVGPSLVLLAGREEDFCLLPTGRKLSPRVLDTILSLAVAAPGGEGYYVKQYQCFQETRQLFRVLLSPTDNAPADLPARVSRAVEELDPEITCRVECVEVIPPAHSGKHRSIVPLQ